MEKIKPALLGRMGLEIILIFFVVFSLMAVPRAASAAGSAEYYVPGDSNQLFQILKDIDNDPDLGIALGGGGACAVAPCNRMHNVITVIVDQNGSQVFYDHWENGYTSGASGDETYAAKQGQILTFESTNIIVPRAAADACSSTNPNGATTACYDGRDRIYVIGGASIVEAFWPEVTATVYANAWEIYPVGALQNNYTIPVGENLGIAPTNYLDFEQVFVTAQATQNGTNVQINDPATPGVEVNTTLNRGQTTQLFHISAGTRVIASAPLQVQFIAGQFHAGLASDSRSYTAVPSTTWGASYYSPVSGFTNGYDTDVFIFNPTAANLSINYQDQLGSGTFVLPPNSTRSYQALTGHYVPANSAVFLEAADKVTKFWAIGAADTGNADFNYGFSLLPPNLLTNNYYLGWAPGTTNLSANGSPLFVTPTVDNTTVYVDYSPTDGVVDATYTLNRLQVQTIFDPDRDNTGMHVWATNRIALVWGEDPNVAGPGNPFIDAGYTILPTRPFLIIPTPTPTGPTPTGNPRTTRTPKACTDPSNCPLGFSIPVTGFSPNVTTRLDPSLRPVYSPTSIILDIPVLKISTSIVGVQQKAGLWDVSWLWNQAGWLEGSAFPTFPGNSIITAHVVTADGKRGPFYHLKQLDESEYVYIYNGSYRYTYKVVSNILVHPDDASVFAHADKPTLTLITCDGYDETTGTYLRRVAVRAVLVDVRLVK